MERGARRRGQVAGDGLAVLALELQHAAILNFVLGKYPVPDSFTKMDGARPGLTRSRDTDA